MPDAYCLLFLWVVCFLLDVLTVLSGLMCAGCSCLLFVGCHVMSVVKYCALRIVRVVSLGVVCCVLVVVRCLLCVVCCSLLLFVFGVSVVGCGVLFGVCWVLFRCTLLGVGLCSCV